MTLTLVQLVNRINSTSRRLIRQGIDMPNLNLYDTADGWLVVDAWRDDRLVRKAYTEAWELNAHLQTRLNLMNVLLKELRQDEQVAS